ncbi:alpha/beta hydrolase, partial [Streptomyces sp. tea 10]|nr:alpha/beta hydrolase [Streptomyces sp. tea 10]
VEVVARVHPGRIRHLVLLDASVPSAEGADPAHDEAATTRRFRRFTLPLARSRVAGAVWRVVGPVVAGRLVPGRGRLMRSWPQLRVDLTSPNFLMGSLRELAGYVACMNRLQELAAHTPLDPELDVLVVAANGRLPRIGTTRWVRHVLARATYLSREAPVHTIVLRRSGHFVMVDHPERIAAVIASVRSGVLPAHG